MQTFHFRLNKVLEWYQHQYELEERQLAVCLAALAGSQKSIAALQAERVSIEQDVVSRDSIPARDFVALGLYRLRAKQRELELHAARDRCQAAVGEQQARLQAAQRRLRLLEKLRQRRVAEYVYAEARPLGGRA